MTPDETALRHNAFIYDTHDEYLARAVPFLQEGLAAGEGAIVANTKPGLAIMREALGADAANVTFVDVSASYTRPARTLAAYHRVYAAQLQKTPTVRAVADVQFGPDSREWDLWTGYEAVFNRSFGHLPAWVLCSYDASGTPDPIIEGVWQTHPEVVDRTTWTTSERSEDPDQLLRRIAPPPDALPHLRTIGSATDPEQVRERLAPELAAAEIAEAKRLEMLARELSTLPYRREGSDGPARDPRARSEARVGARERGAGSREAPGPLFRRLRSVFARGDRGVSPARRVRARTPRSTRPPQ